MIAGLEQQGIPRPEIARATGLSRNTIWRLANGAAREPAFQTVSKVLEFKARVEAQIRPIESKTG